MTLTYLEFLLAFVVVPILALLFAGSGLRPERRVAAAVGMAILGVVALVYTTPWDNYLVALGVWNYGEGRVLARIWHAPAEEYAFILLQTVLTALWLYRRPLPDPEGRLVAPSLVVAIGWIVLAVAGALALSGPTLYLGAILAWAAPVIGFQWLVGGRYLWVVRRRLATAVAIPTFYLCLIDRLAIGLGIWHLSPVHTTGWTVLGLPVEEATFFLLTNGLLVQGLLLFDRVLTEWIRSDDPRPLPGPLRSLIAAGERR